MSKPYGALKTCEELIAACTDGATIYVSAGAEPDVWRIRDPKVAEGTLYGFYSDQDAEPKINHSVQLDTIEKSNGPCACYFFANYWWAYAYARMYSPYRSNTDGGEAVRTG